jgi:phage terminase large subunit
MLGVTTGLRKISALKKRIWCIEGGQGAAKTFSILMLIVDYASSNPNKEIFIASDELSKMRITVIKDFLKVMIGFNIFNRTRWTDGVLYRYPNGSFVRFLGLDKEDIGKGLRSDLIFVNEANKVKFDTYRELTSRAKRVIIDFNPNKKFWAHQQIVTRDDCDFLRLTFNDNEFLSQQERYEILLYKRKGFQLDDKSEFVLKETFDTLGKKVYNRIVLNQYWANMWRVYGEGLPGEVEGRIYTWGKIAYETYLHIEKQEVVGNDWGKVDPWGVVGLKYHDGNLYVDEKNYESENEIEQGLPQSVLHQIRGSETMQADGEKHDGLVSWKFKQFGIPYDTVISCDNNRPNKIRSLRRAGWEYAVAVGGKTDLINRIGILSGLNIFYTDRSTNIEYEQETYCYDKDAAGTLLEKPIDQDNHLIDAIAYGVSKMFEMGIIKNI